MAIAHQPLDVEIFHPDQSTAPSNLRRKLVQQIMARTGNAVMHPGQLAFRLLPVLATVAKICNYPEQDTTIHIIAGKQLCAVTTGGMPNQANQDNNRSFPAHGGQGGSPSVATAAPSLRRYTTQA
jgi:hypothetical protein